MNHLNAPEHQEAAQQMVFALTPELTTATTPATGSPP
jgi:hypothetical protein